MGLGSDVTSGLTVPGLQWAGDIQLPAQTDAQRNSSPRPSRATHLIYEWEWCRCLGFCTPGIWSADRLETGTQMAVNAQCSRKPLGGKASSGAISVIMAAQGLCSLGKTMAAVTNGQAYGPSDTHWPNNTLNKFNQVTDRMQTIVMDFLTFYCKL